VQVAQEDVVQDIDVVRGLPPDVNEVLGRELFVENLATVLSIYDLQAKLLLREI